MDTARPHEPEEEPARTKTGGTSSSGGGGGGGGSSRRARAPSRRVLEASGLMKVDGAQHMTKEVRDAEGKKLKDLRDKRKQGRAAGLRSGEVLEACWMMVPEVVDGGVAAAAAEENNKRKALVHRDDDRDDDRGETGGRGGREGGVLTDDGKKCPKMVPDYEEEEEESPGKSGCPRKDPPAGGEVMSRGVDGGAVLGERDAGVHHATPLPGEARVAAPGEKKRKETSLAEDAGDVGVALAMNEGSSVSARGIDDGRPCSNKRGKYKRERERDEGIGGGGGRGRGGGKKKGRQRTRAVEEDGGKDERGAGDGVPVCEFRSCAKMATFGVNGAVRYW